jgi:phosphotransferase family enzyme
VNIPEELQAWLGAHLAPTGPIELVHERPWSSVYRVRCDRGVVWCKTCAPAQAFEARLTAALAERWSDRAPTVLAHDDERAWLLIGDAGERLGLGGDPDAWLSILPRYAELQRGEAAHRLEHLAAGVPDRALESFPALYDELLARRLPVSASDRACLQEFAPRFAQLVAELAASGIPETIQHDDLHGKNVYGDGRAWLILDWGDSCISHPFLTSFVTFLHLEEMSGVARDDPWLVRLGDAYLEPWGSPGELRETFELALRLGAFAHVFKELRVLDAIPEAMRGRFAPDLSLPLARCVAATLRVT